MTRLRVNFVLARPPDELRSKLVRAKGLEPPHLSILEPKSSASTNSATPARTRQGAGAYTSRGAMGKRLDRNDLAPRGVCRQRRRDVQHDPNDPDEPEEPDVEPSQPGQPSEAPAEEPALPPDIDIPSPSSPGTEPLSTPISPIG